MNDDTLALLACRALLGGINDPQAAIGCLRVVFHWVRDRGLQEKVLSAISLAQVGFHGLRTTLYFRARNKWAGCKTVPCGWTTMLCTFVSRLIEADERKENHELQPEV